VEIINKPEEEKRGLKRQHQLEQQRRIEQERAADKEEEARRRDKCATLFRALLTVAGVMRCERRTRRSLMSVHLFSIG
jgi:hypothetical protein